VLKNKDIKYLKEKNPKRKNPAPKKNDKTIKNPIILDLLVIYFILKV